MFQTRTIIVAEIRKLCFTLANSTILNSSRTKIFLLSSLLVLASHLLRAQEDLENQFIPPKESILSNESEKNVTASSQYPSLTIKLIPTTLVRNIVSMEIEKSLNESFSVGLIGGYCWGKSKVQTQTVNFLNAESNDEILNVEETLKTSKSDGGGMVYGLYLRYFLSEHDNEGDLYLEMQFRHWSHGYKLTVGDALRGSPYGTLNNNFIGLLFGIQSFRGKKGHFVIDRKVGLGVNIGTYVAFAKGEDPDTGDDTYTLNSENNFAFPMFYYSTAFGFAKYRE